MNADDRLTAGHRAAEARAAEVRSTSFGQDHGLSPVDRLGTWLSQRAVTRRTRLDGARWADIGCGYDAHLARGLADRAAATTVVDVALSDAVRADGRLRAIEGVLPEVLADLGDGTFDVITCISVLEHVQDDLRTVCELRRLLADGGTLVLNVPSWWGRTALEFSAFRLGLSPADEMNDHKRYYDPRDLWPLLVRAGFVPQHLSCRRHKLGLNTLAVCHVPGRPSPPGSRT